MKKVLALLLVALMCLSMLDTAFAAEFKFTDVKTGDWFYNDVKTAVEAGLVNGKSDTSYAPYDNLTYAEAIKLAACMNQLYTEGKVTLASGNPWYKPYVDYCIDKEIIDKEYNYEDVATRAGYMGIFAKALPDEGLKAINNVPDDSIPDVPSSRSYAPGVYKLYRAGILQGVDEAHNCNPLANIIRAEVAAIITRMMDETKRVEFSMGAEEKEPEITEPEATKPEVTEPETTEPETTEPSTGSIKDKFEQGESVEYKKEDFSLTVDDCFVVSARGIVVSGRVADGKLNTGDTIYLYDTDGKYFAETKVVGIEMFKKLIDECQKGDNVGLNIDLDTDEWRNKIERGMVFKGTKSEESAETAELTITSQSESGKATYGTGIVTLEVKAEGGKAPYTYQWYKVMTSTIGGRKRTVNVEIEDDGNKTVGAQTASLGRIHEAEGTYKYICKITDADGNTVSSETITITCDTEATGGRGSIPVGKNQYMEE